ncbi:MAG: lipoprotein, partial [Prevotella sp.]|nr:lipoprotein [Prevotella sp.]
MKKILYAIIALAVLTACKKDEEETEVKAGRTVLVYIAAENNLGYEEYIGKKYRNAYDDIQEMKEGVKTMGNNHLVVYVDKP